MLQKSKSKKVWQLKYLLILPIVLGMLLYNSLEGQETTIQANKNDQELIEQIQKEIKENIKKSGSLRALFSDYPQFSKYDSLNPILSKEDFFRQRILWQEMGKEINRRNNRGALKSNLKELDDPSTTIYNSYVSRTKAFQLLDKNLDVSIDMFNYDVILMEQNDINLNDSYFIKVDDLADITGDEIKTFNKQMAAVFEKENTNKSLVLADGSNAVKIFNKVHVEEERRSAVRDYYTFPITEDIISFSKVDEVPIFPGCEEEDDKRGCFHKSIREHIRKNYRYPEGVKKQGIQGVVNIMFIIDENGNITNVRKRGPHKLLEDEAHRIVLMLPQMKPGKQNGKAVKVPFSIPITFKL